MRPQRRPYPVRGGFTFVEVMVVVAIIAIASALVVPMFGQTDTTKLTAAANMAAGDLAFAQIESIGHSDDLRVFVVDTTNHRYSIAAASDTATPITNPITKQPYLITFGSGTAGMLSGVTISGRAFDGDDELKFEKYGQLDQSTDATLTFSSGGKSITLTIDAVTGDVTIGNIF